MRHTLHAAGRQKPAADFSPRKSVSLESNRIDSQPLQLAHTRGAGETTANNHDVVLVHFSATNTSRYGKLRYTRAGMPTRLATSNNSDGRNARSTETGPSCRTILLLLNRSANTRIEKYATALRCRSFTSTRCLATRHISESTRTQLSFE